MSSLLIPLVWWWAADTIC